MPIAAKNAGEMLDRAAEVGRETPFLELRLDSLEKPQLVTGRLKQFLSDRPLITMIATCRRKANGGDFAGSAEEQMEHLLASAKSGCQIVDMEVETAEALKATALDKLRDAGCVVMLSFHDFKGTPDLDAVYDRMAKFSPDFYKIVPTAKSLPDNLKVTALLEKHAEDANVVALAMGNFGVLTRILGPRFGSVFTFGAATVGEETAPGQVAARTLTELYRMDGIEASTRIYGVAGSPVTSSLSPLMINTAFRRETVNAVYVALETGDVKDLLKVMEKLPIHGVSVTMPLKTDILAHLEKTDPLSAKIGACNTVVRAQDGKLYGFNTDVGGIVGPLERRVPLRGAKVLVLGAGGVARAAVFGLKDKGAEVSILNRTPEKAQKLARQAGAKVMRRDQLAKTRFDVVINATPYGMLGQKIAAPISAEELNTGLLFDLVYNPIETPLVRLARSKNIAVVLGVEMFVQQGARQFEIWTGKPAPQEEMLRVVLHALKQQAEANMPPVPVPVAPVVEKPVAPVVEKPAPPVVENPTAPIVPKPAPAVEKPALEKKIEPKPVPVPVQAKPVLKAPVKTVSTKAAIPVAAKKVAPKKAVARKPVVTKPAVKKAVAKKSVAKKVALKKSVAKKAAPVKVAAKKAPTKKAVVKKAVTKKVVAKKLVPKKAAAPVKKAPPRKVAEKKAPLKKSTKKR
ncbi:shikimate dehydrogenase [Terriglobus saanensis]|uniref:shikimate dehydrogenase n=1 Tax=Terriglobus saanensis TaxID=870903 RepID=UPI0001E51ED2|nr:shikimate dehydrogenase [Terriglobus saanensis]